MVLASGLLRMIFQNYQALHRTRLSDKARYVLESCMVEKFAKWNHDGTNPGQKCADSASSTTCSITDADGVTHTVTVSCPAGGMAALEVRFRVTIN
jgi:hypothetical protein